MLRGPRINLVVCSNDLCVCVGRARCPQEEDRGSGELVESAPQRTQGKNKVCGSQYRKPSSPQRVCEAFLW